MVANKANDGPNETPVLETPDLAAVQARIDALPEVLTAEEAALLLRMSLSTLRRLLKQEGALPGVRRIGGEYRFSKSRLLEWIATGTDSGRTRAASRGGDAASPDLDT